MSPPTPRPTVVVDVFAADEQADHEVDVARWAELARGNVLEAPGIRAPHDTEISLLFVDEPTIAELNERFLGRVGPTDVLAFPIDEELAPAGRSPDEGGSGPGGGLAAEDDDIPGLLGDVVVCPAVGLRNAPDHGGLRRGRGGPTRGARDPPP